VIARATTVIATHPFTNFSAGGVGFVLKQLFCRHHHTGRTESALQCGMTDEGILQIADVAVFAQTLNRPHPSAVGLYCKRQTAPHNLAVDFDRAGTADPVFTAEMRALKPEFTTDKIHQMRSGLHMPLRTLTVHGQINALKFGHHESCSKKDLRD